MLMEQTPSSQNWQAVNALKRPGVLRLWSYLAVAHGGVHRAVEAHGAGGAGAGGARAAARAVHQCALRRATRETVRAEPDGSLAQQ